MYRVLLRRLADKLCALGDECSRWTRLTRGGLQSVHPQHTTQTNRLRRIIHTRVPGTRYTCSMHPMTCPEMVVCNDLEIRRDNRHFFLGGTFLYYVPGRLPPGKVRFVLDASSSCLHVRPLCLCPATMSDRPPMKKPFRPSPLHNWVSQPF